MGYFHKETKDCLKCVHKYIFSTIDFSCNMLMYIMYMFYKLILNEEIRFLWATTQLFCLSKSINWRNLIQYYSMQNAPNIHTVMHVLHLCAHLHKVFLFFFFPLKVWLQLAVNQLSRRFGFVVRRQSSYILPNQQMNYNGANPFCIVT